MYQYVHEVEKQQVLEQDEEELEDDPSEGDGDQKAKETSKTSKSFS